jgi:hypothetical protein
MLRLTSIFRESSWTFQNASVCLNRETSMSASRCYIIYVTTVIGPLWDSVNYICSVFQTTSCLTRGAPSAALQQLTTVSPCGRMSLYMTSDYVQPRRPTIRNHLCIQAVERHIAGIQRTVAYKLIAKRWLVTQSGSDFSNAHSTLG